MSMIFPYVELSVVLLLSFMMVFQFFFVENLLSFGLFFDWLSWSMLLLTLFLGSFLNITFGKNIKKLVLNMISSVVIIFFFLTDSAFLFFLFFELSLLPLFLFVVFWGKQAERLKAAYFLFMFTVVSSAPLFMFVIFFYLHDSLSLFLLKEVKSFLGWVSIFAFLVKIPLFFFHSWLPKAHVEAPLEGSMILAGIMLKVGVYGFLRFFLFLEKSAFFQNLIFSIAFSGACMSCLVAMSSDDMKMSVAFSSVSHMNFMFASLLSMKFVAFGASIVVMLCHGLSSPLLFFGVTKLYNMTHSRSLLVSKGVCSKSPFMALLMFLAWSANISPPPFFSFIGELMMIFSLVSFLAWSIVLVLIFFFVNSFFSLVIYGVTTHSSKKLVFKHSSYDFLFSLFSLLVLVLLLFFFFSV
nr:NADH dehydrogenase subunit 4 [Osculotes curta]